jgi:hypothetical protein
MTLAELKAALGKEVLVLTGSNTEGYTKRRGVVNNVVEFAVHYIDRVDRNVEATITMNDESPVTLQVKNKKVYALTDDAALTTKVARLNASVAEITAEDVGE